MFSHIVVGGARRTMISQGIIWNWRFIAERVLSGHVKEISPAAEEFGAFIAISSNLFK